MATTLPVTVLGEFRHLQCANGTAAVLAIGTANPVNYVFQEEYADWYFRVTKSNDLAKLKDQMKRICEKTSITKRYFHLTEEMIDGHPEFLDCDLPSLSTRLGITADAVPELAVATTKKAIAEWGRPATDITHLVVSTNSGAGSPGADVRVAELLGLPPTVQRTMLCLHGCSGGCIALRLAKDLAENNRGARVLVVCSEVFSPLIFGAPDEAKMDTLVVMSLFGDGAGAVIIGAGPTEPMEHPIFDIMSSSEVTLPGTEHAVQFQLSLSGLKFNMSAVLPTLVRSSIEQCLTDMVEPLGPTDGRDGWNGLFWAAHPGGRAILDSYQAALGLEPGKLAASRLVQSEYGNMLGATIFFVLNEIRRRRPEVDEKKGNTNDPSGALCWG